MFTGLVESKGELVDRIVSGGAGKLIVRAKKRFETLIPGESIAVNGACLTLEYEDARGNLVFHTLSETLDRTNLSGLVRGSVLNLERAMKLGDRVGGHLVSGHVDCTGTVRSLARVGDDYELAIDYPQELAPLLVPKGSIAIDGVSLTIARLETDFFAVRLIPVTLAETALETRRPGSAVNLEGDLIGKYVQRYFEVTRNTASRKSAITMQTLQDAGFF